MTDTPAQRFLRQRKTKDPCPRCRLHKERCLCALLVPLSLETRLTLLIHHREIKRTTNTGLLATEMLTNSRVVIRGKPNDPHPLSGVLDDAYNTILLYPADDAIELAEYLKTSSPRPIHLLVPDGNWRQASKVHTRHPELKNLQRVKLTPTEAATHFMRRESMTDGMATLEAIAEAMHHLEGAHASTPLRNLYREKLNRTLVGRGSFNVDFRG